MISLKNPKVIRTFLILVALHSFVVGINLISFPSEWMQQFGFNAITENFFKVQGGIFHVVMTIAYLLGAWKPVEHRIMIIFAIIAKFLATIFLITYFFISGSTIVILLSAISDFTMAIILLFLNLKLAPSK
ncbi:MAG: hypothetical protein P8Y99_14925 [Calditrichaceae bacterium]